MTLRTDRSRIVAYRNCPRLRYWQYECDGTGLEPVAMGLPLAFGIGLHEAFALLLQGAEPEAVGGRTRWQLQDLWEERGLKDGAHALPAFFMAEQQWLA